MSKSRFTGDTLSCTKTATGYRVSNGGAFDLQGDRARCVDYSVSLKGTVYNQGVLTAAADGKTLTDKSWTPGKGSEASVGVYEKR